MKKTVTFILFFFVSGCASISPKELVPPGEVSVENAIEDVARGLAGFNQINRRNNINSGLLVDEVTINLELAASAKDNSNLVVDLSRTSTGATSTANAEVGAESAANVGNMVELKFKNIYTAALNQPGITAVGEGGSGADGVTLFSTTGSGGSVEIDCNNPPTDAARTSCLLLSGR